MRDIKKIKQVTNVLNGWCFHELKSQAENFHQVFLFNKAGLFIQVTNIYGEKLEQWALGFEHPQKKRFQRVAKIGSDLKKNPSSISRDLENRLLINSGEAYQKLADETEAYKRKIDDLTRDTLIISSLKKVCNVRELYNWRDPWQSFCLEDENDRTIMNMEKIKGDSKIDITIRDLKLETVFKLIHLIKEERA